jgi:tetratricopeptide (TPR) repeat protein
MKHIVIVFLLLSCLTTTSQSKKLWLKKGDDAFIMKDYPTAIDFYTKISDDTTILAELVFPYEVQLINLKSKEFKPDSLKKHQKNKVNTASRINYLYHQLAECYRLNKDYINAEKFYKIVVENKSYPGDALMYAKSLINLKDYQIAETKLEELLKSTSNDSLIKCIQKSISSCQFSQDTSSFKKKILVYKLDTLIFNSGTSNFAPMYYGSPTKLLFTSARKGGVLLDPETQDSRYLCDIYYTEYIDSSWIKPINYGRPVNTGLHEGSSVVTSDNVMFFTRWNDANRSESFIYMAKMKDGMFFEAYKLNETVNIKGYKAMHPFVSFDGTKLLKRIKQRILDACKAAYEKGRSI